MPRIQRIVASWLAPADLVRSPPGSSSRWICHRTAILLDPFSCDMLTYNGFHEDVQFRACAVLNLGSHFLVTSTCPVYLPFHRPGVCAGCGCASPGYEYSVGRGFWSRMPHSPTAVVSSNVVLKTRSCTSLLELFRAGSSNRGVVHSSYFTRALVSSR